MVGARVNGKLVNIDYVIQNGNRIEIITSRIPKVPAGTGCLWSRAHRQEIRSISGLRPELKEDNITKGKEMIDRYCKAKGINYPEINKQESGKGYGPVCF